MQPKAVFTALQHHVRAAGLTIAEHFVAQPRLAVAYKQGVADFVTALDTATEQQLITNLSALIPESGFLAEETASDNPQVLNTHPYTWIIDPIDGTTNFVHKLPLCALSVALYQGQQPIMAVVYNPITQDMFCADSSGAWHNDQPLQVSSNQYRAQALYATGLVSFGRDDERHFYSLLEVLTRGSRGFRRMGSAALDLCYVAKGTFDVFYEKGIHPWDVAAGAFIVRQAGGTVTDYNGTEDYLFAREIVAGGSLHADTLAEVQRHYQRRRV